MVDEINTNLDTNDLPQNTYKAKDREAASLANWIRQKTYGRHVRESIARFVELTSDKVFDTVQMTSETVRVANETQERLNQQIGALTEDAELIDARGGESILNARLDRIEKSTTLSYLNGVYQILAGETISTTGFYETGDSGGFVYRYVCQPLDGSEVFEDTGKGFMLSKNGSLKLSESLKLTPEISTEVYVGSLGANNHNDDKIVQASLNVAKEKDVSLNINTNVSLTGSIDVYRNGSDEQRRIIEIIGRGIITKNNSGPMFTNTLSRSGGNLHFKGIHFRSVAGAGTKVFEGGYLLRMYFSQCHFLNVDQLTYAGGTNANWNYLQTLFLSQCTFVGGNGWLIDATTAYDISINQCLVEHRQHFTRIGLCHSVRITDNVIEGLKGKVLEFTGGRSLVFESNYLEHNCQDINEPYIIYDNKPIKSDLTEWNGVSIRNNLIISVIETQRDKTSYHFMRINYLAKSTIIEGNFCDCNFMEVVYPHSYATNTIALESIYRQNIQAGKNVINDFSVGHVIQYGSGNGVRKFFEGELSLDNFQFIGSGSLTKSITDESIIRMISPVGTTSSKFGVILKSVQLHRDVMYVTGVRARFGGGLQDFSGLEITCRETTSGTVIWRRTLDIQHDIINVSRLGFYTLPPFITTEPKIVDFEISAVPSNGTFGESSQHVLDVANFVLQRGTIATDSIN